MESWRDEKRTPLSELNRAMGTYSTDGQLDDASGGDVGAEETIAAVDSEVPADHDPDPDTEAGRRARPTPDSGTGPS